MSQYGGLSTGDFIAHTAKNGNYYDKGGKVLANGAVAGFVMGPKGPVFRILASTPGAAKRARDARSNPRQITQAEAQAAFDRHYRRTNTIKRGPRKGQPRYASPRGRNSARSYDLNHTSGRVISDARYLHSPHLYDFRGVDTGTKVRKPLTEKQRAALGLGRAALQRRRSPTPAPRKLKQAGGYWW